jgi:hypothetical protein
MQFNLKARFTIQEEDKTKTSKTGKPIKRKMVLCFTHAVQAAIKGIKVEVEIDEFGMSDYDFRSTRCSKC